VKWWEKLARYLYRAPPESGYQSDIHPTNAGPETFIMGLHQNQGSMGWVLEATIDDNLNREVDSWK
jgi:hypothetical protein